VIGRSAARAALVAAAIAVGATGCSPKKVLAPNAEPQTTLFVQFDAADTVSHTVHHEVHLYWYGTDSDGYVVAYDVRFIDPGGPADPPWTRTTRTDSLFTVQVPTGSLAPTFEVRSIDDDGAIDETPASQQLSLSNAAPTVTLRDPPRSADTTFATQSIAWTGIDPDGDASKLTYHVWLDGNEATPHVMSESEFTFPSADFLRGSPAHYGFGPRTAYVQAFDSGGRASVIQSATWFVRAPVADTSVTQGRLLLIDNVPTTNPANGAIDNVYNLAVNRAVATGMPATQVSVLRLQTNRPFRSTEDLLQTLQLFRAVVWYRGTERFNTTRDTLLVLHSDAVRDYVNGGGKVFFESLDLANGDDTNGILSQTFLRDVLGCDSLYRFKPINSDNYTEDWGINSGGVLRSASYAYDDSLRSSAIFSGMRGFGARDTSTVALWGRAGSLAPAVPFDIPVALRVTAGSGRIVVVSVPLVGLNGFASLPRFLDKVFADLGATGPSPGFSSASFTRSIPRSIPVNRRVSVARIRR
jgi:hypothetical protein